MANIMKRPTINLAKKLHKFTNEHHRDMKSIIQETGQLVAGMEESFGRVHNECPIFASSGRPTDRKMVSMTHVNRELSEEIQTYFTFYSMRDEKYEIIKIIDTGIQYGERRIVTSRSADTIKTMSEKMLFDNHGVPNIILADH